MPGKFPIGQTAEFCSYLFTLSSVEMFPTLGCCKMGHFARLVFRTWEISRKLRGTGVRSVRYYRCQYDRCQRFAARSDETSFEVNAWPPSSQMRCPRRLLSRRMPARSRSLVKRLADC